MANRMDEANEVFARNKLISQGVVTNDNIVPLISFVTLGIVWIIHDLVTHGYSAEADVDLENYKVKMQMRSHCDG